MARKKGFWTIVCLATFIIFTFVPPLLAAVKPEVFFLYGYRTVSSAGIREVYGNGFVYYPAISINIMKGFFVGTGYEGGYSRSGRIGIFEDYSTLKIYGVEGFAGYAFNLAAISFYARAGLGFYRYKQFIDVPDLPYKVDNWTVTQLVAGGARYFIGKNLFLTAELKYVRMKVKPVEEEVDLGGLRFLGGLGFRF